MLNITIEKSKLLKALTQMKSTIRSLGKKAKLTQCEITITDNNLSLTVPGIVLDVPCSVYGAAKVSIPLHYFFDIINVIKNKPTLKIIINDGEMVIGSLSVPVSTTFFTNDKILRSIKLPANYTQLDLLRLVKSGKYTFDEFYFNRLTVKIDIAETHLKRNINSAYQILSLYGVAKNEIEELVEKNI
jgi:hypothetical protein